MRVCGSSSVGRVSAFQADCREFESRLPLHKKESHQWLFFIVLIKYFQRCKHNKKDLFEGLFKNGGCGGTRTHDQLIKSQLRYQLRHAPIYLVFICYVASVNCYLSKNPQRFGFFSAESTALRTHTYLIFSQQMFCRQIHLNTNFFNSKIFFFSF